MSDPDSSEPFDWRSPEDPATGAVQPADGGPATGAAAGGAAPGFDDQNYVQDNGDGTFTAVVGGQDFGSYRDADTAQGVYNAAFGIYQSTTAPFTSALDTPFMNPASMFSPRSPLVQYVVAPNTSAPAREWGELQPDGTVTVYRDTGLGAQAVRNEPFWQNQGLPNPGLAARPGQPRPAAAQPARGERQGTPGQPIFNRQPYDLGIQAAHEAYLVARLKELEIPTMRLADERARHQLAFDAALRQTQLMGFAVDPAKFAAKLFQQGWAPGGAAGAPAAASGPQRRFSGMTADQILDQFPDVRQFILSNTGWAQDTQAQQILREWVRIAGQDPNAAAVKQALGL